MSEAMETAWERPGEQKLDGKLILHRAQMHLSTDYWLADGRADQVWANASWAAVLMLSRLIRELQ